MENEQYYWSTSGKRYHESRSCPHLKNVKNPLHGNLQSAKRGGRTPCSHCCTVSPAVVQSVNEGFDIDHMNLKKIFSHFLQKTLQAVANLKGLAYNIGMIQTSPRLSTMRTMAGSYFLVIP